MTPLRKRDVKDAKVKAKQVTATKWLNQS